MKAARGTKRVCQACDVRFYDLGRDPVVCPACAAEYKLVSAPAAPEARVASYTNKTGWRSKTVKQPSRELPVYAPEEEEVPDAAPDDDVSAEDTAPEPDDALVLEPDAEDGDYTDVIDVPVVEPKEQ